MFINITYRLALPVLAVLLVSACEMSKEKRDHDPFDGGVATVVETTEPVSLSAENVEAVELDSNSSVEIFDMELNPDYHRGVQSAPSLASAGGGVQSADPSVTIYPLDGMPVYSGSYNKSYGQGHGTQVDGQIFFKHGSSRLGSGDMRKISNIADQAKFAPVNYVTVEGFASKPTQVGSNTAQAHIINLRQSMKRSEKVSEALVRKGVPGEKIKTVSWGASKATGNSSQDRRVDVVMGEK